jgi:hypothetical protein
LHHKVDELMNAVDSKAVLPTRLTGVYEKTNGKFPNTVTQTDPDAGKKDSDESKRHSGISFISQKPILEALKVKFEALAKSPNEIKMMHANNNDVSLL